MREPVTVKHTLTLVQEAVADLRRLGELAIERALASEATDWAAPQRALDALREGMRLLSWLPYSCCRAELGNGRSREMIVPFGGRGCIVLFEIVDDDVVVVRAARDRREYDYRN